MLSVRREGRGSHPRGLCDDGGTAEHHCLGYHVEHSLSSWIAGGADRARRTFYVADRWKPRTGHGQDAMTQVLRVSVGRIHQRKL